MIRRRKNKPRSPCLTVALTLSPSTCTRPDRSKRLKNAEEETDHFLAVAATLGDRLGPLLFQLPPNLKKDLPRLDAFLAHLGKRAPAALEFRQSHGAFFSGALALTLNASAYISEIVRAGIHSIARGQVQAAESLGLDEYQTMRFIVLPQALRRMVPPLVNEAVTLLKDSSLVSAIGLAELAMAARTVAGANSRYWEPFLAISAIYLVMTSVITLLARRLETPEAQRGR